MPAKFCDITGLKVGLLTVRSIHSRGGGKPTLWLCDCECGGTIVKPLSDLKRTKFSSCGCRKDNPSRALDHTGRRYGNIVGIERTSETKNSQIVWKWKCDCGVVFASVAGNIVHRGGVSGCPSCSEKYKTELLVERLSTHKMSKTKEYKSWAKIKERSFNKNDKEYKNYGARGIVICDEWKDDFQLFYDYIGPMPDDGKKYTCGRSDNNLGYQPGNVRWEDKYQQARNKTLSSANTSGIVGVKLDNKRSKAQNKDFWYWVALWNDLSGKQRTKAYSISKYGDELARFLAEEKRDIEIRKLNMLGANYSPNHGLPKKVKEINIEDKSE